MSHRSIFRKIQGLGNTTNPEKNDIDSNINDKNYLLDSSTKVIDITNMKSDENCKSSDGITKIDASEHISNTRESPIDTKIIQENIKQAEEDCKISSNVDQTNVINDNEKTENDNRQIDWSSYPLLKLNEIPLLNLQELEEIKNELNDLMKDLQAAGDAESRDLLRYADRETLAIEKHRKYLEATARLKDAFPSEDIEMNRTQMVSPRFEPKATPRMNLDHVPKASPRDLNTENSGVFTARSTKEGTHSEEPKPTVVIQRRVATYSSSPSMVKEFVVFSETKRSRRKKQLEMERRRMLENARLMKQKKEERAKKLMQESRNAASERLRQREQSRKQWESERKERLARAEKVREEINIKKQNDDTVRKSTDIVSESPKRKLPSAISEEADEELEMLQDALEEERAANESNEDKEDAIMIATRDPAIFAQKEEPTESGGDDGGMQSTDDDDSSEEEPQPPPLRKGRPPKPDKTTSQPANRSREPERPTVPRRKSGSKPSATNTDRARDKASIKKPTESKKSSVSKPSKPVNTEPEKNAQDTRRRNPSRLLTENLKPPPTHDENLRKTHVDDGPILAKEDSAKPVAKSEDEQRETDHSDVAHYSSTLIREDSGNILAPRKIGIPALIADDNGEDSSRVSTIASGKRTQRDESSRSTYDDDKGLRGTGRSNVHSDDDENASKSETYRTSHTSEFDENDDGTNASVGDRFTGRSSTREDYDMKDSARSSTSRSDMQDEDDSNTEFSATVMRSSRSSARSTQSTGTTHGEIWEEKDDYQKSSARVHMVALSARSKEGRHDNDHDEDVKRIQAQKLAFSETFEKSYSNAPDDFSALDEFKAGLDDDDDDDDDRSSSGDSDASEKLSILSNAPRTTSPLLDETIKCPREPRKTGLRGEMEKSENIAKPPKKVEPPEPPSLMTQILQEIGGVTDYSDHFNAFGEVFTAYAKCNKAERPAMVEETVKLMVNFYVSANRVVNLQFQGNTGDGDTSARSSYLTDERYYRVLSRTREEVTNIIQDCCENLDNITLQYSLDKMLDLRNDKNGKATARSRSSANPKKPMLRLPESLGSLWNTLWTWSKPKVNWEELFVWQKVNHFENSKVLTRKDLMKSELQRVRALSSYHSKEFEMLPDTFILPKEYLAFIDSFSQYEELGEKNLWIMKPVGLSRGRGISMVSDIGDVCYDQSVIIQRYIANPLLLDGYKFDMRVYVLVTSFTPLEAWVYNEGFVRVCTEHYSTNSVDTKNLFVHLTNSSIQQTTSRGASVEATKVTRERHAARIDEAGGTKLTLSYLWRRLRSEGRDVDAIIQAMHVLILKSLVCCSEKISHQPNCFEIYGYDVLLDEDLRPWLIEVNSSPSLAQENELDTRVKRAMVADTMRLVNPMQYDREALLFVLENRAKEYERNRLRPFQRRERLTEQEKLNRELTCIFHGKLPRKYGEMPEYVGAYTRLCPNEAIHEHVMKLMRSDSEVSKSASKVPIRRRKPANVGRTGLSRFAPGSQIP